ncbi:MAG: CDP-glucose 4,6-dehydratase [Bacteroidota bacterium]|nr:CDP-glucose 4,6-dehydratase [Bacteroidota bacterium]
MNPSFWKNKKVFITGHTGFKGSWLSLWLQSAGAQLVGYALPPPTSPNLFTDAHVEEGMKSIIGDIRDLQLLKKSIAEHRPEIIIHMAAQTVVRTSYDNPVETYETNVMGTVNILEALRSAPSVKVFVNVTTDKCYENHEWSWGYRETDSLGGFDPYSNSKACSELVTSAYRNSFFSSGNTTIAIATARAGNVIGGGDWTKDQLIPDIFRALLTDKSILLRSPKAVRPWQFVLEPLDGYLTLAEHLWDTGSKYAEAWNFGPSYDDAKPVEWIAEKINQLWGGKHLIEIDTTNQPHEAGYLKLDASKATAHLQWHPMLRLSEALEWVTEWYSVYHQKNNISELTRQQIARYTALEKR